MAAGKILARYRAFLEVQESPASTIVAYTHTASKFLRFLRGKDPKEATEDDVVEFLRTFASKSTRFRHHYGLKSFLAYIHNEKAIKRLKPPRREEELTWWLTKDEVRQLMKAAYDKQIYAILRVAYDLALRVSEICDLNRSDLRGNRLIVRIRKKRRRVRTVAKELYPETRKALEEWLATRKDDNPAMFITRRGRPYHGTIQRWLHKVAKLAKIEIPEGEELSIHTLRHSRAAHLREAGTPLDTLRLFLCHERIETTQIYAHIGPETIKREVPPPGL